MKTSPHVTFFTKAKNPRHNPWKIPYDVPAAFPVLDGSPSETAKYWAGEGYKEYRYQNTFDDVRILDLDRRSQGGRAYKIIITTLNGHEFVCDLREDTLLDVIKNSSIQNGGRLMGKFSWIQNGSQCTLIRVDSDIWNEVQQQMEAKGKKIIPKRSLEFGHLYSSSGGSFAIFIAEVFSRKYDIRYGEDQQTYLTPRHDIESSLIFLKVNDKVAAEDLNNKLISGTLKYWYVDFVQKHSYRMDHGKVLDDSLMPESILGAFKSEMTSRLRTILTRMDSNSSMYSWELKTCMSECNAQLTKDAVSNETVKVSELYQKL